MGAALVACVSITPMFLIITATEKQAPAKRTSPRPRVMGVVRRRVWYTVYRPPVVIAFSTRARPGSAGARKRGTLNGEGALRSRDLDESGSQ